MNKTISTTHPAGNFNAADYLELAGVMLLVVNDDDSIIWLNRKGCEVLGCKDAEELKGKDFFEFIPSENRAQTKAKFYRAKQKGNGKTESFETEIKSLQKEEKLVLWTISAAHDMAGKNTATLISGEDVTQVRHNEAELKTIRERIDFALKSSKLGIWEWDVNTNDIYWSDELKDLYGLAKAENAGTYEDYLARINVDDRDLLSDRVTRAIEQGEAYSIEHRVTSSDGTNRWVLGKGRPVYNKQGELEKISGIAIDITEQKEREEQLHFQANILQNMQEAVMVLNEEGKITFWNEGASELFGYHQGEVLDEPLQFIFSIEEDNQVLPNLEQVSLGNDISTELTGKSSQGETIWLSINFSALQDSNGKAIGILAIGQDITQKKQAEEDRKLLQHISHRISHSENIEEALSNTLQAVGQHIGWWAAEAWLPVWNGDKILQVATWQKDRDAETNRSPYFIESNKGLAGKVYKNSTASWVLNAETYLKDQPNRPQKEIKTAIGLPVTHKDEVQAILLFYSGQERNEKAELLNILQSITSQLAADIYLKLEQGELKHFYELSSDLMMISTPEGKIKRMNPAMQEMAGKGSTDKLSRTKDFLHPQDIAERDKAIAKLSAQYPEGELVTRVNSGANEFRWVQWNFRLDTGKGLIYSIGRDITEQKKLEDAIHNIEMGTAGYSGEEYFSFLVKYLSMLLDAEYALVGSLEGEEIKRVRSLAFARNGKKIDNISFSLEGTPLSTARPIGITAANGGLKENFPESQLAKDYDADSIFGCYLLNSSGGKEGILMLMASKPVNDASAAKMLLQIFSVRAASELLRDRSFTDIKNMNVALKERARQLTEVNQKLESFSKAVSQDLRNPLFQLTSAISEIEKELTSDTKGLKTLQTAGSQLRQLLNSIIDYSQAQSVQPTYDLTNFNRVLGKAKSNLTNLLNKSNVQLEIQNLPTLVANEDQMVQLFESLISSCLKNTSQPTAKIIVEGNERDDKYEFIIHHSNLPFRLSDLSLTTTSVEEEKLNPRPTGEVNLILMKLIIENHGGKIWQQNNTIHFTVAN